MGGHPRLAWTRQKLWKGGQRPRSRACGGDAHSCPRGSCGSVGDVGPFRAAASRSPRSATRRTHSHGTISETSLCPGFLWTPGCSATAMVEMKFAGRGGRRSNACTHAASPPGHTAIIVSQCVRAPTGPLPPSREPAGVLRGSAPTPGWQPSLWQTAFAHR